MNHVTCHACNTKYVCYKNVLEAHALTKTHLKNCKNKNIPVILDFSMPEQSHIERIVAAAELKYTAIFVILNFAFRNSKILAHLLTSIDRNSIFRFIRVGPTKVRNIIVKIIAQFSKRALANILRESRFCVCVDESTDVSKNKILLITVRYPDGYAQKVHSRTWDMPRVYMKGKAADGGAERIFNIIRESFENPHVPLKNIVACCSDGAKTMVGDITGLKRRMIQAIPNLKWVRCPAHKTHLCASHAVKLLPSEITKLISNFHTMVNVSPKRQHNFDKLQHELELPKRKIPRIFEVRWLSLEMCTDRSIEQWQALLAFAGELGKDDEKARDIYKTMQKPQTLCYFYLLRFVLGHLNRLNKFYQREDVIIQNTATMVERTFKTILASIMDIKKIVNIPAKDINLMDERAYLSFVDFDFGDDYRHYIIREKDQNLEQFFRDAYNFVCSACIEMYLRWNGFEDDLYSAFKCMQPDNALSRVSRY